MRHAWVPMYGSCRPRSVQPALDQRRIDLALGHLPEIDGTPHEQLIVDRYVLLVCRDHPFAERLGSSEARHSLEYVVAQSRPGPEKALRRVGLADQIRLILPHYSAVADVVANTALVAIIPRRPAVRYARHFPLGTAEIQANLPQLGIWAHWSRRAESDPGHRWHQALANLYRAEDQLGNQPATATHRARAASKPPRRHGPAHRQLLLEESIRIALHADIREIAGARSIKPASTRGLVLSTTAPGSRKPSDRPGLFSESQNFSHDRRYSDKHSYRGERGSICATRMAGKISLNAPAARSR